MGWVTGTWAQRQAPAQRVTAAPASAAEEPEERGCKKSSFINHNMYKVINNIPAGAGP